MCIALYITEIQILSTQKSELPSPPRVRPRITGTRPHTVQNPERGGSPTMESMRQALQAQTPPSGQVLKTIRRF